MKGRCVFVFLQLCLFLGRFHMVELLIYLFVFFWRLSGAVGLEDCLLAVVLPCSLGNPWSGRWSSWPLGREAEAFLEVEAAKQEAKEADE